MNMKEYQLNLPGVYIVAAEIQFTLEFLYIEDVISQSMIYYQPYNLQYSPHHSHNGS